LWSVNVATIVLIVLPTVEFDGASPLTIGLLQA
jgi:hypothetical protein